MLFVKSQMLFEIVVRTVEIALSTFEKENFFIIEQRRGCTERLNVNHSLGLFFRVDKNYLLRSYRKFLKL